MPGHAKNWCFTLNNPQNDITDQLQATPDLIYAVWQLEEGAMGTPHYQGYLMFSAKKRFATVQAWLPGAHLESARGTPKENRRYCTKQETRIGEPYELGTFPETGQGRRVDLEELHSALKDGLGQADYIERFFPLWVRYPNLITTFQCHSIRPRDPDQEVKVYLFIGPPRQGKSRYANHLARQRPGGCFRLWNGQWFDGYGGQRTVLIDDFTGSTCSFRSFKLMCDRFPFRVEIKGTSCEMAADTFYITTNEDPRDWWSKEVIKGNEKAITDRISEVFFFPRINQFVHFDSFDAYERSVLTPVGDGVAPPWEESLQEVLYENL